MAETRTDQLPKGPWCAPFSQEGRGRWCLTPGPPLLCSTPRAGLTQPAGGRRGKQAERVGPGGFTRERARRGHTQPEREEGRAGQGGWARLPAGGSGLRGCHSHPRPAHPGSRGWPATVPAQEGRKGPWQRWEPVPGRWKPAQPRGGLGPPPPTGGTPGQAGSPRVRTALHWACREAAVSKRGAAVCSSDYREVPPCHWEFSRSWIPHPWLPGEAADLGTDFLRT